MIIAANCYSQDSKMIIKQDTVYGEIVLKQSVEFKKDTLFIRQDQISKLDSIIEQRKKIK
jgi:hypothetical protein